MTGAGRILIAHGRARLAADEIAGLRPGADVFEAVPGMTPALRLNTDDGTRLTPAALAAMEGTAGRLAAVRAGIERGLDPFARPARLFLDRYFAFVAARIGESRAPLTERVAWAGGLLSADDWCFSALRPLAGAFVVDAAAVDAGEALPRLDFAFWTGEEALGVLLRGGDTPTPLARRAEAALAARGVRLIAVAVADLQAGRDVFAPFPPAFREFWQGEPHPMGPFRPPGLASELQLEDV